MDHALEEPDFDVRVEHCLALKSLAGTRVLAGRAGLLRSARRVRIAPQDRRVHGNYADAVVLLDGEALTVDTYVVDVTLRWMRDAGAPALIVLSPAHAVGMASIRLAERFGIALAESTRSDVLELADELRDVVESPVRATAKLLSASITRLNRVAVSMRSVVALMDVLDSTLNSTSSLVGLEGEVLAGAALDPHLESRDRITVQVLRYYGSTARMVQPVRLAGGERPSFWLVVESVAPTPMWRQAAASVVTLASSFIAVRLLSDRLEQERDARARLGVLNAIVALTDRPTPSLVQQIGTLGWNTDGWCTAVHIRVAGSADTLLLLSLTREMRGVLTEAGVSGPVVERPDGWTTWSTVATEPPTSSFGTTAVAVRSALRQFVSTRAGLRAYAGVGRPYPGVVGLQKSLAEAQQSLTIAQAGGGRTGVRHIDELGIQRILIGWYSSSEFGDFASTLLRPVTDMDREEDLMRTLEVYLDNESSPTVTADVLGLHRNTVINRIARIRKVLHVDLDDPDERLAVQLACRVIGAR